MRAGGCAVQQALTAEAAAVVKQAVSLARRRGNAQVTPLHVASAMLHAGAGAAPATTGLLRAACLRSHSHPLQCKALELCFNVALNRLPASAGASPLLGHGAHVYYPPSLSNALVAAFKRAQAHQRRGSVETQQQPVLAVKIELEQLVISILDDPSVSRVMREAGFSSTQVKANVEQAVSSIDASKPCTTGGTATASPENPNPSGGAAAGSSPPVQEAKLSKLLPLDQVREEDVAAILDCLATRSKKRIMVVAECAAAAEEAARAAVDRIRRGEARQQNEALRAAQVVTLSVSRFRDAPRDQAERRLAELRCVVRAAGGKGRAVVLVVEDLAWAAEFWAGRVADTTGRRPTCGYYYCAVERAVAEVRALACHGGDGVVWLVGHGTYQTNMRCRAGHPSLESFWGLQTLAVPAGSLALSLTCADADADSGAMAAVNHQSVKARSDRCANGSSTSPCLSLLDTGGACSGQMMADSACCGDCAATMKALPRSVVPPSTTTSIPPWLQHHCRDQEPPHIKKWMSAHGGSPSRRTALNISTVVSPCSSVSSYEHQYYQLHQPYQPWLVADDDEADETKHPWKSRCRGGVVVGGADDSDKLLPAKVKSHDSSASNGSVEVECRSRFKELSAENLKVLCGALEKEVPWQKEIVPEIASTVLRCRSGMAKRARDDGSSSKPPAGSKEHTWMLFLGGNMDGKVRVARELARLVFGSSKSFVSIGNVNASSSSPVRSGSSEQQHRSKRPRPEEKTTSGRDQDHLEKLYDAVRDNPRRVILMEHVDQADLRCQQGIREAIRSGVVRSHRDGGEEAVLGDAIVVLSCESFSSSSTTPAMIKKVKKDSTSGEGLDEDDHHRKEAVAAASSSSSCFDLNMSVEDDEAAEERCSGEEAGLLLLKAVDRVLFFRSNEEL
ncbi:hypothetical protein E2562_023629 [Oryza meyeriana var. granulata]|uniref:Clp R domain-containing protein n=1 Tax=Oryza meyeriana var. granulata TaxID=110450 RepID=A0A6G1FBP7_9ORYZ|nr:hypothetical protein E2562_023629 [Oryza meyeriana var. granulata]